MAAKAKYGEPHGAPFEVSGYGAAFFDGIAAEALDPEEALIAAQEAAFSELNRVLDALPEKEARCLRAYFSGITQQAIADQEGVTQACVSIRCARGLEKLLAMRDRGELETIGQIWGAIVRAKREINSDSDSSKHLPIHEKDNDDQSN